MAFMDQMNPSGAAPGAIPSAGSIGLSSRPKQRYIDKILMRNRDREAQTANENNPMMQPSGPATMGVGPGTNIFGGQGAFNRPNTMAMMLGGR